MRFLKEQIKRLDEYKKMSDCINKDTLPIAAAGLSLLGKAAVIYTAVSELKLSPLIITESDTVAERLAEDLQNMGVECLLFPARDYCFRRSATSSHFGEHTRIGTLTNLLNGTKKPVIASLSAAAQRTVSPNLLKKRCFKIYNNSTVSLNTIIEILVSGGYSRCEQVDGAGQFSVRGGILDLFTPNLTAPCRIDFFGDDIDSISLFDPETQRRTDVLTEIEITPVLENFPENINAFKENINGLLKSKKITEKQILGIENDKKRLEGGIMPSADIYMQFCGEFATLFDYFKGGHIFFCDSSDTLNAYDGCLALHSEDIKTLLEEGELFQGFAPVFATKQNVIDFLSQSKPIFLENFPRSKYELPIKELLNFTIPQAPNFYGSIDALCEDINSSKNRLTVIMMGNERTATTLCNELEENGLHAMLSLNPDSVGERGIFVSTGILSAGLEIPDQKFSIIVHSKATVAKHKRKHKKGTTINSLEELRIGDYVVHASNGIGIYDGVQQITTRGMTRDYIKIRYAGKDVLYVPVTSLDMVSAYIGSKEDTPLKLHRLGSADWQKTKARVRSAVKDIAKQLTALYAKRMQVKGHAFSADCDMQSDFERRFPYDETDDQLRCINEIKNDMERSVPMDRLLCGDVGFGKTEVALRAAYKCILDGKQCAILVPTTILAWQHYNTALERFSSTPASIEMLSRFRTAKQQSAIKKDLKNGRIDLLIGTHSIISNDVVFKDLGLLIIDEEQRFGVAQKEKLKELFPAVDTLTLSATPIPRTLNMALSGLRDMSSIEEAPQNRYPVHTYVLEQDNGVVAEAINKELRRGGQVYYLHNRTDTIENTAFKLQKRFPEARVGVAHGKMGEENLSKVWKSLLEHEIDILVCTTIIETGVDVPNANTLIVENADRMGLSQLHQLRGRIGRSHRQGYAYFFFPPTKQLSDVSAKRLDAIRQYTEFGSGFRIAMRDLEIRGAGNLIGGEQHGHMEAVGYELYLSMLSDALAEEKGETAAPQDECEIDIKISAHIPEKYISSLPQRIGVYRKIADIRTEEDVLEVTDELLDRFGDLPKDVTDLIKISYLKNQVACFGVTSVNEQQTSLLLYVRKIDECLSSLLTSPLKSRVLLNAGAKPYFAIRLVNGESTLTLLENIVKILKNSAKKE